jgi:hypothetical protein
VDPKLVCHLPSSKPAPPSLTCPAVALIGYSTNLALAPAAWSTSELLTLARLLGHLPGSGHGPGESLKTLMLLCWELSGIGCSSLSVLPCAVGRGALWLLAPETLLSLATFPI